MQKGKIKKKKDKNIQSFIQNFKNKLKKRKLKKKNVNLNFF